MYKIFDIVNSRYLTEWVGLSDLEGYYKVEVPNTIAEFNTREAAIKYIIEIVTDTWWSADMPNCCIEQFEIVEC